MPRFERSGVHLFAEEDTVEAVVLGPVGLGVPVPWVVGQVLGHRRTGVQPYLWHAKGTGAVLGQDEQLGSDAPALGSGQHAHVLQQQIARPGEMRMMKPATSPSTAATQAWLRRIAAL